jgi:hypothetical protein
MTRRFQNLDDLIHELDQTESLADDPFGAFEDDDLAILGAASPDAPRPSQPAPKRRLPRRKKT